MRKLLVSLLSILMAVSLWLPISANGNNYTTVLVSTEEQLRAELSNGTSDKTIYLQNNIALKEPLVIQGAKNVTIDMAYYMIYADNTDENSFNKGTYDSIINIKSSDDVKIVSGTTGILSNNKTKHVISVENSSIDMTYVRLVNTVEGDSSSTGHEEGGSPLLLSNSRLTLSGKQDALGCNFGDVIFVLNSNDSAAIITDKKSSISTGYTNIQLQNTNNNKPFILVNDNSSGNSGTIDLSNCYLLSVPRDIEIIASSNSDDDVQNMIRLEEGGTTSIIGQGDQLVGKPSNNLEYNKESGKYVISEYENDPDVPMGEGCIYGMCGMEFDDPTLIKAGTESGDAAIRDLLNWFKGEDESPKTLENSYRLSYSTPIIVNGNKTLNMNGHSIDLRFSKDEINGTDVVATIIITPGSSLTVNGGAIEISDRTSSGEPLDYQGKTFCTIYNLGTLVINDGASISASGGGLNLTVSGIHNGAISGKINGKEYSEISTKPVDNSKIEAIINNCSNIFAQTAAINNAAAVNNSSVTIHNVTTSDSKILNFISQDTCYAVLENFGESYIVGKDSIRTNVASIEDWGLFPELTAKFVEFSIHISENDSLELNNVLSNVTFRKEGNGRLTVNGYEVKKKFVVPAEGYRSPVVVDDKEKDKLDSVNDKLKKANGNIDIDNDTKNNLNEAIAYNSTLELRMTQDTANSSDVSSIQRSTYGPDVIESFDLSMEIMKDKNESIGKVKETGGEEIEVTVTLDEDYIVSGGQYYIVTVHNGGKPEEIEVDASKVNTDGTLTFKTSEFSTFSICVKGGLKKESSSRPSSTAISSDPCTERIGTGWVYDEAKGYCVYKGSGQVIPNTSVK